MVQFPGSTIVTMWKAAERYQQPLSCMMLDIDHFKSVNDRYGHATGDQALLEVSGVLRSLARTSDLVCRYGGEEFCVVFSHVNLEGAAQAGERFRRAIEERQFSGISVTASFGVSAIQLGAADHNALLQEADKALYVAKRSGRNRVVRWNEVPEEMKADEPKAPALPARVEKEAEADVPVSYHAVASLVSALAYRDVYTAEHSRRVADLCVATARGLMSERECYVLEIAALLHDIGKLGVPDAVLRKPGPLTEQEWKVMGSHDQMGVEIITAAFASTGLSEIVRNHHAWYGGNPRSPELPIGEEVPLGARILAIVDAYDAMSTDRVYRKRLSREAIFEELRRCSGTQFDPNLVDRFIEIIMATDEHGSIPRPTLSKRTAFKIGLQIEKLAEALDSKDPQKLTAMASRLRETAAEQQIGSIAEAAARLESAVASKCDWLQALELTGDLLELCRSTQSRYLDTLHLAEERRIDHAPGPLGVDRGLIPV
jgi:diguanylate cyclase (GGDEF)-like protein/putative nucleotidyltransferase with HDIG domain